ncbi:TPR-like protein [Patellaria atrata CBS 101060]|uniref:TPR-like protein n=1 Tax=Patellaria atrata CBS 101060 TaxID=1346257 RepID=A0A9P4VV67_9PEZI|nr:TPR-like protein [Patellaria atrata CBS 101060]
MAAPTNTSYISSQLRHLIYYNLDNDLIGNALFLSGRLHAVEPRSPDAIHLLALSHLRLGRLKAAYDYTRDKAVRGIHLGCAYVFAQACLGLERYGDGIAALERSRGLWGARNHWNKHSETQRKHIPDAAVVNCLLGKLWRAHGDVKKAVEYYVACLKLNPFMWDAFLELCDTGAVLKTENIFKMTPEMQAYLGSTENSKNGYEGLLPEEHLPSEVNNIMTPSNDLFNPSSRPNIEVRPDVGGSFSFSRLTGGVPSSNTHSLEAETPTSNLINQDDDVMMGDAAPAPSQRYGDSEPPQAPIRKTRTLQTFVSEHGLEAPKMRPISTRGRLKASSESNDAEPARTQPLAHNHKRTISGHVAQPSTSANNDPTAAPQRRSVRLFNQIRPSASKTSIPTISRDPEPKERREIKKVRATGTKGRSAASTVGRVVSGNRNPREGAERDIKEARPPSVVPPAMVLPTVQKSQPHIPEVSLEKEALHWLLDLFVKLGSGYFFLGRYQCQQAINAYMSIPASQRETPWVLAQLGKAHYERSAYTEAGEVFTRVRKIEPSRMEDMEIYSTVLWHLKNDMELAYLSHELIDADRLSPQAWCTIGNSFSLQREHDQAVKCFKRATQLDPKFAYAFTLQGHEHIANEEYDKALFAYRCAISADNRHYNGWYGLGRCYERLGKYDIAEKHYKSASQINPTNAVLVVCIGVVFEKMNKARQALVNYSHACELDPLSALARFKKARVLMALRHSTEALIELKVLKDIAPDEANVHFMLGRLYKLMNEKALAIRHFTVAINLDPKAAQYIKEAMESMDDEDDGYDDGTGS